MKTVTVQDPPTTNPVWLTDRQGAARYQMSRSTWWRMVKEGRLPKPVKLGPGITRWRLADLQQWEAGVQS